MVVVLLRQYNWIYYLHLAAVYICTDIRVTHCSKLIVYTLAEYNNEKTIL